MDKSKIEWTDSTFNPWIGCTKISPACDHCYAEELMDKRMRRAEWGAGKPRSRTSAANWKDPVRWNAQPFVECMGCHWRGESRVAPLKDSVPGTEIGSGPWRCCPRCHEPLLKETRRRVFCASLADVFDNEVPWQWRLDLFGLIRDTPNLDWLLLTKRIGNVFPMLTEIQVHGPLGDVFPNVWLGATICNQEEADRDIPKLLQVPVAKRFLSVEPLLESIDLAHAACWPCPNGEMAIMDPETGAYECCRACDFTGITNELGVHWVIVGGESGAHARPMHPDWARALRDQCVAAGVPFFFKQWGEWAPNWLNDSTGKIAGSEWMDRMGKRLAGRTLDGHTWSQWPAATELQP